MVIYCDDEDLYCDNEEYYCDGSVIVRDEEHDTTEYKDILY